MLLLAAERLQRLCGFPVFFFGGIAAIFNGIIADLIQRPPLGELRCRTAQFKIIEHELLPVVEQARCGRLTLMLLDETQFEALKPAVPSAQRVGTVQPYTGGARIYLK